MKLLRNILIVLAIVGLLLIPKFFCGNANKQEQGKKGGNKAPIGISVYKVMQENIAEIYKVNGTLLPNEQVELKAESQGLIKKVYFKEGANVVKEELLLKLNDADFQTQLNKAQATKKLKEDNAARNSVLLKKEAISQADYDLSVSELSAIEADIAYLKEQIRKTELRAPFSGTLGLRQVSEGAYITPATSIATLQDASQLKIEFSVPEKYFSKINIGDEIKFTINNQSKTYTAKIYAREVGLSDATRSIVMRALCNNSSAKLIPGLFATIELQLATNNNSFLIPTQSLIPVLKGQKVFKVQGDSAVEVLVKTGFRNEDKIEITEGLNAGDEVIVDGIMYVKQGAKVKVTRK